MPRVAPAIPDESDILCEACGYTLNGLPHEARCPECGRPIVESTAGDGRAPARWETDGGIVAFAKTTMQVLFRPTRFYRTLATRRPLRQAAQFAWIHWIVASLLLGLTAQRHLRWQDYAIGMRGPRFETAAAVLLLTMLALVTIAGTTWLAARLTAWEAAYRGLRLPLPVVKRGLYYHAAHYLPVAMLALAIVLGYQWLIARKLVDPFLSAQRYLYTLAAAVIVSAGYLFKTYWIAMRNMMYANR